MGEDVGVRACLIAAGDEPCEGGRSWTLGCGVALEGRGDACSVLSTGEMR